MIWKKAVRAALHQMGGLAVLRGRHRRKFGVLMFHAFNEADRENLEAICSHIVSFFQPVSLSTIADALEQGKELPDNAIAVTVDDGYRSFLLHGHPVFRRSRIPTTLYAVAGFAAGRLWLWPDQIEFGLRHTARNFIAVSVGDSQTLELALGTPEQKTDAIFRLNESLKEVRNEQRIGFLADFGRLCEVEIPLSAPGGREAMNWDELRAVAAEGVEIGCHTETHPILSRLSNPLELQSEIRGAKDHLEERLGFAVRHFCYPNGRPIDVGDAAIRCVREAGFASAVCGSWGLNTIRAERFEIRRIPFNSDIDLQYGLERMAGLHL